MTQARITTTQVTVRASCACSALLSCFLPGVALVATILLAGCAIAGAGGHRWRWAAVAAAVFAFTLLTVPHRLEVRDVGGGSALDREASPR